MECRHDSDARIASFVSTFAYFESADDCDAPSRFVLSFCFVLRVGFDAECKKNELFNNI